MALTKVDISLVDNATGFTIVTKVVTVAASKLVIDGVSQDTLTLTEGYTYKFDTSHATMSGHTVSFATAADAAGSTQYTTGVTTSGTPGSANAYTQIVVAASAPVLYYYCANHASMGGTISTPAAVIANKLLAYDGSGNLPAVDGSQMINVSTGVTASASDPTISTNPSGGVGTEWHNTTSGEAYICTDATAGANVWKNVGAGTDNIEPWAFGGTLNGFHHGGYTTGSGSDLIQYYSFTSDGNAVDSGGNLTSVTAWTSAHQNGDHTYGYRMGGWSGLNVIDKYQFGAGANATDVGDCISSGNHGTGNSSADYAYTIGGSPSTIEKTAFASDANATSVGTGGQGHGTYTGFSSTTHGYAAGGADGISQIDRWTFASDGNSTDVGDLTVGGYGAGGHSSDTAGYRSGGYSTPSYFNIIEKMPFATDVTADHGADLTRSPDTAGSNSSTTNGYSCGGHYGGYQSDIDKFPFATSTNATDIGNLVLTRTGLNGCGQ